MSWLLLEAPVQTVPIVPRAPLPPFDHDTTDSETGAPLPVHTTPIWPVPVGPEVRYWRANAWAVTLPGLPFVNGGSSKHPERCLTWFFDRYPTIWQSRILDAHRQRGYTHFTLSWPDSRDGNSQSIAQYVATARRIHQAGFFVHHMLSSKDFDPRDMTLDDYAGRVAPVIDALAVANALDSACVGWELDAFNSPAELPYIIFWLRSVLPPDVPLYVHFQAGKMSWQRPGLNSLAFWRECSSLTGLLWQANQHWSAGMMSARLNDCQVRFAQLAKEGLVFDLVAWELIASLQFDGEEDEDRGDLLGYEIALCTPGPHAISGFGNGARHSNGRPI